MFDIGEEYEGSRHTHGHMTFCLEWPILDGWHGLVLQIMQWFDVFGGGYSQYRAGGADKFLSLQN